MNGPERRTYPYSRRGMGWLMVGVGMMVLMAVAMVPIPDFQDLEARPGTLVDAGRERFSPCRFGDCTRTMVTVRHADGVRRYHFADVDLDRLDIGAPITVWTYAEIRGFSRIRAWHAEQNGRVIRDYARLAGSDRRIRVILVLLVPALFIAGGWLVRTGQPRME